MLLENHEKVFREKNIIINNIPERDQSSNSESLRTDAEKLHFLIETADLKVDCDDIVSIQRIGKPQKGDKSKSRQIKVSLKDRNIKFEFLNNRKNIASNDELKSVLYSRIFVNSDSSFLIQKEEFRLRQKLKQLKSEKPNGRYYIRSGHLYVDEISVDKVDVINQLF
jgi:hypothetical protein